MNSLKTDEFICRICFETETDNNLLIKPCKCTGSMQHVHENCLKIWITTSNQTISESFCDICKEYFEIDIKLCNKCSLEKVKTESFKLFVFPIFICSVFSVFVVILYYFIRGFVTGNLSLEQKISFSIVMVAWLIIIGAFTIAFVRTIVSCYEKKVDKWKIKSIDQDYKSFNINYQTDVTCRNELGSNETGFVVSPMTKFQVKNGLIHDKSIENSLECGSDRNVSRIDDGRNQENCENFK